MERGAWGIGKRFIKALTLDFYQLGAAFTRASSQCQGESSLLRGATGIYQKFSLKLIFHFAVMHCAWSLTKHFRRSKLEKVFLPWEITIPIGRVTSSFSCWDGECQINFVVLILSCNTSQISDKLSSCPKVCIPFFPVGDAFPSMN